MPTGFPLAPPSDILPTEKKLIDCTYCTYLSDARINITENNTSTQVDLISSKLEADLEIKYPDKNRKKLTKVNVIFCRDLVEKWLLKKEINSSKKKYATAITKNAIEFCNAPVLLLFFIAEYIISAKPNISPNHLNAPPRR